MQDSQFQWDNLQKSQFYKGLPAVLPQLPHRVALHRVVPCLAKEFVNPHMVPFVLPAVLQVAEEASNQDFVQYILPELKPVMKIPEPVQVRSKGNVDGAELNDVSWTSLDSFRCS